MRRWSQIICCLAIAAVTRADGGSAHEFSASIETVERATNGIYINFTVKGEPDFIDIEGSPTLTGIYREEQDVAMVSTSLGRMRALIPIPVSKEDRFFRIRLMSAGITNTLMLPIDAQEGFGQSFIPTHITPLQQVYAASEFYNAPTDIIDIKGIALRLNAPDAILDTVVKRLTIHLGVYRGAMEALPPRGFVVPEFVSTVLDAENVRLVRTPGNPRPDAFDIRIEFQKPYRYNWQDGQLVIHIEKISTASGGFNLDAVYPAEGRGLVYLSDFPNAPSAGNSMLVTTFLYTGVIGL